MLLIWYKEKVVGTARNFGDLYYAVAIPTVVLGGALSIPAVLYRSNNAVSFLLFLTAVLATVVTMLLILARSSLTRELDALIRSRLARIIVAMAVVPPALLVGIFFEMSRNFDLEAALMAILILPCCVFAAYAVIVSRKTNA